MEKVLDEGIIMKNGKILRKITKEDFTFETFIPGDNSNFAYNASLAVSKKYFKGFSWNIGLFCSANPCSPFDFNT